MRKDPRLTERARELRRDMTPAERILWSVVRGRRLAGFRFRRQQPVGPFIVDFFCAKAGLIVELDGETHLGREDEDKSRQNWLEREGYKVLRFWNTDLYEDRDAVQEMIWRECTQRVGPLTPGPSPPRGEGRKQSPPGAP